MDIEQFYKRGSAVFLPNLSIDHVIVGYQDNTLKCLLLRIGDKWLLPGGFIRRDESVDRAARRILSERTGLQEPHLNLLSVFGDRDRRFGEQWKAYIRKSGYPWDEEYWVNDRFVTLAYYSLVHIGDIRPVSGPFDEDSGWFPMDRLPGMWMDHKEIVAKARDRMKQDVLQGQMSIGLLSEPFTMPELHQLHQTILDESLERSRFQKKMLATGQFERLPRLRRDAPGRNPYQYRLRSGG